MRNYTVYGVRLDVLFAYHSVPSSLSPATCHVSSVPFTGVDLCVPQLSGVHT